MSFCLSCHCQTPSSNIDPVVDETFPETLSDTTRLRRQRFTDESPLCKANHPFGSFRRLGIMSNHDDRPAFFVELLEEADYLGSRLGVKVACRLVCEDDRGIIGQHPGERHPLLLTHAQLGRFVIHAVP